jgi:hypothetical protein
MMLKSSNTSRKNTAMDSSFILSVKITVDRPNPSSHRTPPSSGQERSAGNHPQPGRKHNLPLPAWGLKGLRLHVQVTDPQPGGWLLSPNSSGWLAYGCHWLNKVLCSISWLRDVFRGPSRSGRKPDPQELERLTSKRIIIRLFPV